MSYPGGKGASGVAQTIINQQPPHDVYIEPFLGGGSVMFFKRPARLNVGIDLDASIIDGPGATRSGFEFLIGDGVSYLRRRGYTGRELVYCDPPYLLSVRKSARPIYKHELLSEEDHRELLEVLLGLPCMVQISGYWSSLYAEVLEGWRLVRFPAMTRGGVAEECLWMNYPEPVALHDYRYLGATFRERERVKRKVTRWSSRIASLPALERLALYSAMSAVLDGTGDGGRRASRSLVVLPAALLEMAMSADIDENSAMGSDDLVASTLPARCDRTAGSTHSGVLQL